MSTLKEKLTNPLRSRKVQVAIATVVVAYLAEWGIDVSEGLLVGIIATGVAVILGIAHEDNGAKAAAVRVLPSEPLLLQEAKGINETVAEAVHEGVAVAMETSNKAIEELTNTIRANLNGQQR